MELRNIIYKGYTNLDVRVTDFIDRIITEVEKKGEVTEYDKSLLNMLVIQLVLYYKAIDEIVSNKNVTHEDNYDRKARNPEITVMNKANDEIILLLDKLAVAPYSQAKVAKLKRTDDGEKAKEILEDLLS